jgi:valyl-tRNA synthetase
VQAPDGRRMSKSLGTGIDPLDLIATHGADALRFGLLMMSSTQDVRFNEDRVRQGRQLATKLWNATRLVVERGGRAHASSPAPTTLADRWIASRTARAVAEADALLSRFELSRLADLLYHLVFDDFCDWYLELLKVGEATPETAGDVLEQLLALLHPLMPFVTEECHARLPGTAGLMAVHPPARAPGPEDVEAERVIDELRDRVVALRKLREDRGLRRREPLPVDFEPEPALAALTGAVHAPDAAAAGAVDRSAERARLEREIARAESERARAERQLANAGFTSRAPAHLVEAEREKAARFAAELARLRAERDELGVA